MAVIGGGGVLNRFGKLGLPLLDNPLEQLFLVTFKVPEDVVFSALILFFEVDQVGDMEFLAAAVLEVGLPPPILACLGALEESWLAEAEAVFGEV